MNENYSNILIMCSVQDPTYRNTDLVNMEAQTDLQAS